MGVTGEDENFPVRKIFREAKEHGAKSDIAKERLSEPVAGPPAEFCCFGKWGNMGGDDYSLVACEGVGKSSA